MALTLPYPSLSFVPLDVLTAEEMNEIVANYTYIANQFPIDTTNIASNAVTDAKIGWSTMPYQEVILTSDVTIPSGTPGQNWKTWVELGVTSTGKFCVSTFGRFTGNASSSSSVIAGGVRVDMTRGGTTTTIFDQGYVNAIPQGGGNAIREPLTSTFAYDLQSGDTLEVKLAQTDISPCIVRSGSGIMIFRIR